MIAKLIYNLVTVSRLHGDITIVPGGYKLTYKWDRPPWRKNTTTSLTPCYIASWLVELQYSNGISLCVYVSTGIVFQWVVICYIIHPQSNRVNKTPQYRQPINQEKCDVWCLKLLVNNHDNVWLVVWNIWTIFPYLGNNNHPNWRSPSFFRGVGQPPTRCAMPQ